MGIGSNRLDWRVRNVHQIRMKQNPRIATGPHNRPVVRVKPSTYQPTRAELREEVRIDATPEELARTVLRPVRVVRDPDA